VALTASWPDIRAFTPVFDGLWPGMTEQMLIMPACALTDALVRRRAGFAKLPLELGVGRPALQIVRHLAQLAGNAEIEARLREAAAALCQLDEKFGVGHTQAIPADGENPLPPKRSECRAGNLQCSRALIASEAELSSLISIRSAVFSQARAVSTKAC
jgi:hypothetical protein